MDSSLEEIHDILLETGLPSTINDLKNPTKEYVVNLITTFLRRFKIDVFAIDSPTMDQLNLMTHLDDPDIIKIINLQAIMVQICDHIFVQEFCITDITSPGAKRIRKLAKFLANFLLYANSKESENQDRIDDILSKRKNLQALVDEKNEIQEAIENKVLYRAQSLKEKEKLLAKIKQIRSQNEASNKNYHGSIAIKTAAEERKHKSLELLGTYKTEAITLSKTITELKSRKVSSPENYRNRLKNLEEGRKSQDTKRELMRKEFEEKKSLIELKENSLSKIQKLSEKCSEVQDIYEKLNKDSVRSCNITKEKETYRATVSELEKKLAAIKCQFNETENSEHQSEHEKRLFDLRNLDAQLVSKKKSGKLKLDKQQATCAEINLENNRTLDVIKNLEQEMSFFYENCQRLYDQEIEAEANMRKTLDLIADRGEKLLLNAKKQGPNEK